jgi:hypothetical protein
LNTAEPHLHTSRDGAAAGAAGVVEMAVETWDVDVDVDADHMMTAGVEVSAFAFGSIRNLHLCAADAR